MTETEMLNELTKLRDELSVLKDRLSHLEATVTERTQSQQTYQPTSVQEQLAQEIMSRPARPDQSTQYSGR
ncbi:hypothetical protein [Lihuaxuella thermophila]|uniref:Uncharacterized protein n=1 Tax=Lihuaxuella thermophila TaxID=1173111 RepID=A0A1H8E4Y3_9BACL|nr:hypothetical protein [Lihuaxuella thermophila]SEN13848.1 hypothetical protein SAMN05444955_106106 [Lihuaxuella thermophila]